MRTVIRLAEKDDAAQVHAIYAPIVRDTVTSFEVTPPTVADMAGRIAGTLLHFPWLVCEKDGLILGYAYAGRHQSRAAYQWSVDTSIYVREEARRTGVGRALYCSLFSILRIQGFFNAYAGIALPNTASVGLHEAVGFTPVGVYRSVGYKLGAWHDVGWWQRALQPRVASPGAPRDLKYAQRSADWSAAIAAGQFVMGE
jgi:L-amino acid N-acyltransferase YncA